MRSLVARFTNSFRGTSLWLSLWAVVWSGCVAMGWYLVESKASTAAAPRDFEKLWPTESQLSRDGDRPTLLVFVHPRCPCSRATLSELARLLPRIPGRASVKAVVLAPLGETPDWFQTDIWHAARAIPGVEVIADADGAEAQLFRADVSGRTLLYSAAGELLFDGGITQSRGHAGDNPGSEAIAGLLLNGKAGLVHGRAFGCRLSAPVSADADGGQRCIAP